MLELWANPEKPCFKNSGENFLFCIFPLWKMQIYILCRILEQIFCNFSSVKLYSTASKMCFLLDSILRWNLAPPFLQNVRLYSLWWGSLVKCLLHKWFEPELWTKLLSIIYEIWLYWTLVVIQLDISTFNISYFLFLAFYCGFQMDCIENLLWRIKLRKIDSCGAIVQTPSLHATSFVQIKMQLE